MSFTAKLLKSTQSALPLRLDFWETLAHGFRFEVPPEDFPARLLALQSAGAFAGLAGELNPVLAEASESILRTPPPPDVVVRWSADPVSSVFRLASPAPCRDGEAALWRKCGMALTGPRDSVEDLLAPDVERSFRISGDAPAPRLTFPDEREAMLLHALLQPTPLVAGVSPWAELGAHCGLSAEETLAAVRRLMAAGIIRRVALRWSPAGLGWRGCGLAEWPVPDRESGAAVATALAGFAGTGDVAWREGGTLTALFLVPAEGIGDAAAAAAGERLGLSALRWTPLRELR